MEGNPTWTRDKLAVSPRPNVEQDDYRPWHEAQNTIGRQRETAKEGIDSGRLDWHDRSYTWHCKCGRSTSRRHEAISTMWAEETTSAAARRDTSVRVLRVLE
ncbi:MAG: hypothetical protein ABI807_05570 [Sporichthyaceae bacterium]